MTCKFNKKEDLPSYHPHFDKNFNKGKGYISSTGHSVFDRLENSPDYDINGKSVYYGVCKCGCITEDRGIEIGVHPEISLKVDEYQLHYCYHCRKTIIIKIRN